MKTKQDECIKKLSSELLRCVKCKKWYAKSTGWYLCPVCMKNFLNRLKKIKIHEIDYFTEVNEYNKFTSESIYSKVRSWFNKMRKEQSVERI